MTGFWRGEEEEIVRLELTPTIWEASQIELLEKASARLGVSKHPVHLKVDTGMGRLGVTPEELPGICSTLKSSSHLLLEGLSTHLASSEVLDAPSVDEQLKRFEMRNDFENGLRPHCSAAIPGCNLAPSPGITWCGRAALYGALSAL
jgi:alanine racemase